MNKHLMAAAIAAAMIAPAAHATTVALPGDASWADFTVDAFSAQDFGNGWIDTNDGSALDFTFTVAAGMHGVLTVVDAGFAGDSFTITNFGNVIGTTSSVPAGQPVGATVLDYDDALANPAYSRGVFTLAPGSYSISGSLLQSVFGDEGATSGGLRLSVTAVPEPANAALMFAGAAALALLARRRKPGRSADAI
jgi:hypothetical protein